MAGFFDSYLAGGQAARQEQDQQTQRQRDSVAFDQQQTQFNQSQQDRLHGQVARAALYLHSLPPERRAAAYSGFVPLVRQAFPNEQIPDQYGPDVEDAITKIVTMAGGQQNQGDVPAQRQYLEWLASQVPENERQQVFRVAAGTDPRARAQLYEGAGGAYQVNLGQNPSARPIGVGGPAPQAAQPQSQFTLDDAALEALRNVPANERPAALQAMMTGGVFHPGPNGQPVAGYSPGFSPSTAPVRQLEPAPKPEQAPSGYRYGPGGSLQAIPGGPADPSAKPARPMPAATRRILNDERELALTAGNVNSNIDKWVGWLESGKLPLGPVSNLVNSGKNSIGQSDETSRNYGSFRAGLEKMRNDSLRLNKGVQTEGDAVRAWNELLANINDEAFVMQRLKEIRELNDRARLLHEQNVQEVEADYGAASPQAPAPRPAQSGWSIKAIP